MFLGLCATSVAQENPATLSPEDARQCTELTKVMARNLYLYDEEYLKLKVLNEKTMLKAQEISKGYQNAPTQREAKLKELSTEFENEVKKMLDEQRLVALASYKINASLWLNTPQALKSLQGSIE
ncbi:hypothetical protein FVR03_18045 [Pontibacter qinzhouensis]|uniref:Uncharacterized protein n=1 Tax=Pontibacter qinzhouensis TaxID=2603253 RepID=A0A5C8JG85_9BACT|nr:hypothetical protein [Pontibacter qinzhouensis]TXK36402.1 hypothetical protein FVR03_18045 [Pontibacter qinzhouensis]